MIDKCPLSLGYNCEAPEYMTTASVCWLQNGIFCPWQQGHTFVCFFWWRGLHATTTLLTLKWTFCPCVFNVSSKTAGQRQGQLSHRTAATIVCMFAYTCVHGPSAPICKLCGWICVFCLDLGKFGLEQHQQTSENVWNVSYSCLRLTCGWVGLRICSNK